MKLKLKIGIVVDQMLPGGVQLAAIEQVRELNRLGHSAKLLILMRKKYPKDFSYLVSGVPHQYLSDSYPRFFKNTIKLPIFNFLSTLHLVSPILAPFVVKRNEYDILISWGTTTCLTTQALYKSRKIPYIAIIHDPIIYILDKVYPNTYLKYFFLILKPLAKALESSFLHDAFTTATISKVHYDYIKTNYNISPEILPLGIKAPLSIPNKRGRWLLSFGRWQKEKNPEFLLELVQKIPESKLIIAGTWIDKVELSNFKNQIKRYGLRKRVKVIPSYSTQYDLPRLCKRARLFLHPHFEAFGLAALEAASYGLPIIIPQNSGVTEKFKNGIHGFFPKKVEIKAYKKCVELLLGNERLAYTMGKAASKVARAEYSWKTNVQKLITIANSFITKLPRPKVIVIEEGHAALGSSLAGGDKLMEPMAVKLSKKYDFEIIIPQIGAKHWLNAPFKKDLHILPKNNFDGKGTPFPVFLSYCIRMLQSYQILLKLKQKNVVYSSTNILPDVMPAFFIKLTSPDTLWIARVHHLIPPPLEREGRLIVNIVSYLMQKASLFMIKGKSDSIIALNSNLEKQLLKVGFPANKLKVLGAGINYTKIRGQKASKSPDKFDGIFVGRLHPAKGIFDLVPIWKRVADEVPNAKLAIIGEGPSETKKYIQRMIDDAKMTKNIKLLGYLPESRLYSTLKTAEVFLFTDHEAGWSIATAEAMAAGLPVVGYDIGILGSVFSKGFFKVPLKRYDLFSQKIVLLLINKTTRRKLRNKAIQEVSFYDWNITANRFDKILQGLIS